MKKEQETNDVTTGVNSSLTGGDCSKDCPWDAEFALFVLKQCVASRILLFVIQLVMNIVVTDYPTDAFQGVPVPEEEFSRADKWIQFIFGGLAKWDSVYFLHIAQYGYTYENTLAFFPLFPTLVHYLTIIWSWAVPFIHFSTALLLTALTVNFITFLLCGQLLYALVLILSKSTKLSVLACLVFSFNPASIFFSAVYSESIYMLLTLSGMLVLYVDPTIPFIRHVVAALFFSFAFATRSNGIFNFGYIIFELMVETIYSKSSNRFIWERDYGTVLLKIFRFFMVIIVCWGIFGSHVVSHGSKMYRIFCSSNDTNKLVNVIPDVVYQYALLNGLVLPCDLNNLTWCTQGRNMFNPMPMFYKNIQKKYWQVEPFGYWQWKKIPCFTMAAPATLIIFYGCLLEISRIRTLYKSLFDAVLGTFQCANNVLPFTIHALILTALALVLYNVEVVTRILFSSSPFIYLVIAQYMDSRTPLVTLDDVQYPPIFPFFPNFSRTHWMHTLLLCYLLGYFYIGTLLHVNWLPFT
ncbi:unnamed protein product [Thelazia callipaeda]|uniref:GPI mannosyltransferase 2 n=1 Tax=Thelazia callipaeda TaxID=103827 RepID=A0A0N5D635_THECL|nr:unnamed protein product [Thelazia callipaeda]